MAQISEQRPFQLQQCTIMADKGTVMRRLKNITLDKLIAHHLDHIKGKKVISKEEQPFSAQVGDFLTQHLRKCSMLQRPRSAVFQDPPGAVAISCRKVLSRPATFVEESGKIAEALYESMGKNRNIDPGFLAVCLCTNVDENYRFLALLKMDPHSIFRARVGQSVEIVPEGLALPDPEGHLQKFAFVRKAAGDSMPEILLLDMQARADEVANFFQNHFLRSRFCKDDTSRTKEFCTTFRNWVNLKLKNNEIKPQEGTGLMKACDAALHSQRINLEAFAQAQIERPELVSDLLDYCAEKDLDTDFTVDRNTAMRFLRTRKIRLDRAEIKIKDADLDDPGFYTTHKDPNDPEVTVVQMRTRTYQILG
jgi:hypothetical protein